MNTTAIGIVSWPEIWGIWVTVAAVVVALFIGVFNIFQMKRFRQQERKEAILTEIMDWVEKIIDSISQSESEYSPDFLTKSAADQKMEEVWMSKIRANAIAWRIVSPRAKHARIEYLAKAHIPTLSDRVSEIGTSLQDLSTVLDTYSRTAGNPSSDEWQNLIDKLHTDAGALLEASARMKLKKDVTL